MLRTEDFKLLTTHGKLDVKKDSEAKIRNDLFMMGSLKLRFSNDENKNIDLRIVGYEVPLQSGQSRGKCIDLLAYDSNLNPYIIELKKGLSTDKLDMVCEQIKDYQSDLSKLIKNISIEIKNKLFISNFALTSDIKKIILAPRIYFEKNKKLKNGFQDIMKQNSDILFTSFSNLKDVENILVNNKDIVELKIYNK